VLNGSLFRGALPLSGPQQISTVSEAENVTDQTLVCRSRRLMLVMTIVRLRGSFENGPLMSVRAGGAVAEAPATVDVDATIRSGSDVPHGPGMFGDN